MSEQHILAAIERLKALLDETGVPRNVRARIELTIQALETEAEPRVKVNKALNELEIIAEDLNVEPTTRTAIFNVVSVLEIV